MNVDSNTLETPFDDVQALPPDVVSVTPSMLLPRRGDQGLTPARSQLPNVPQVSLLRLRLRKVALAPGEGVSRLFLKAQALLFGGYRDALICSPVSSGEAKGEACWVLEGTTTTVIIIPSLYGVLTLCLCLFICQMESHEYPHKRVMGVRECACAKYLDSA